MLYLWNLSASGCANSFYSAAVQAGSQSWKAFFFGSLDAASAVTVDKPSAFLWPVELSVRIFGLDSWAILTPQVLMGVGTVTVVHAGVRRRFGPAAGLIAGAVLALTPVAALMFRFDNPDAMLALLMALTAYFVTRALGDGRTRWLLRAGAAVGFAFLAKTLRAFLILPPPAVVYAVRAPVEVRKRCAQLGLAAVMAVAGGWWVAIVELWPASSRPYVGGSQDNSFLELTFGYNGLGRLNGEETGSVGGGGTAGESGGPGGGMGGLLDGADVDSEAGKLLETGADDYTWVAAAVGARNAAAHRLATGEPVMAIGGFNGTDPSPTLDRFKEYVAEGTIHYLVPSGTGGGTRGGSTASDSGTASRISSWVDENFTEVTAGSATFYDLTRPAGAS